MVEIEGRKRKQTFATVFCSPNTCLVGRCSGWIRFRFFVEVFASSLRRFRFTGVVGEVPWEQRDLCEVYKVYERRIAMLLKRIYFSLNKIADFFVSSLMVFFLLFDGTTPVWSSRSDVGLNSAGGAQKLPGPHQTEERTPSRKKQINQQTCLRKNIFSSAA